MKKVNYLIIGAGISGLSFANFIESEDYLIIEKENEIGGYCRTVDRNGYIWDYAGHFFHFSDQQFKELFLDSLSDKEIVYRDKVTNILFKNRLIDYPFQKNIHQLDKEDMIDCLYDLFDKTEKDQYDNFLDMLYGKFGKSIVHMFLKPYNEKLYAINLEELDTDAMGRFFPYADIKDIIMNMKKEKDNSYNNNFLYPKKGAITFLNLLYDKLDHSKIILNKSVTEIDAINKRAVLNDGEVIEYNYIINSAPFNEFLRYFNYEKYDLYSTTLSYNKVLVFNLGFSKKSKFTKEHWLYIPDSTVNFYRIGFYDNILDVDRLSMYVEIGYSKEQEITAAEVENQLKETIKNFEKIGILEADNQLIDYEPVIMDPAYVHISKRSNEIKDEVLKELVNKDIYSIGRYGYWTYCSMEDCMIQARATAKEILKK